jgi:prepilin-type processing-associated H-X9-DG protein
LLPVFTQERGSHATPCLSNLKQLSLCAAMYAQDYDEKLPSAAAWNEQTMPYTNSASIYRCPREKVQSVPSYGMNRYLSSCKEAAIEDPAKIVLLLDSRPGVNVQVTRYAFVPDRHHNYVNIAFSDFHVKTIATAVVPNLAWTPPRLPAGVPSLKHNVR